MEEGGRGWMREREALCTSTNEAYESEYESDQIPLDTFQFTDTIFTTFASFPPSSSPPFLLSSSPPCHAGGSDGGTDGQP